MMGAGQPARDQVAALVLRLESLAKEQVNARAGVEARWLDAVRQHQGQYDPETAAGMSKEGSRVFVNLTKAKTNTAEARLGDMLFPTDDRNWGIRPTPVPESAEPMAAAAAPPGVPPGMPGAPGPQATELSRDLADKAQAMEREMDDQLVECRFQAVCRDVIHDAALLGTGVIKGPMVLHASRSRWEPVGGEAEHRAETVTRPFFERVDPWGFFPDMNARGMEGAAFAFQRHPMRARDLQKLAEKPGFDRKEIKALLSDGAQAHGGGRGAAAYLSDLRGVSGLDAPSGHFFEVWEYHGPVRGDEQEAAAAEATGEAAADLDRRDAVVWFCGGRLLKFALNHMDTGELPYSVFCWERDDAGVFGYGIPHMMRTPQRVVNAAFRMILDNAALSTGPQIIMDRGIVEPADGQWRITPRKIWFKQDRSQPIDAAFRTFHIDSRQPELAAIFSQAQALIDMETGQPQITHGDPAQQTPQNATALGTSMMQGAANVIQRRTVRNFDDDLIKPVITRLYHWNMQFNLKPEIKGDFEVEPRGVSALMSREIQASQLMAMAANFAGHPAAAPLLKLAELLRKMAQMMGLPADEIIKTDADLEADAAARQGQPPPMDPKTQIEMQRLQIEGQKLQLQERQQALKEQEAGHKQRLDALKEARAAGLDVSAALLEMLSPAPALLQ